MDQEQARALFEKGGFLLLPGLTPASEFGIDSNVWRVQDFGGIKFLPPGLHLIYFSGAPTSSEVTPEAISSGLGVRRGFFHRVKPGEVVAREYDPASEDVSVSGTSKANEPGTIVSRDYLKSIDRRLAPYPLDRWTEWKGLTSMIADVCLGRVIGFDERGDARVEGIMSDLVERSTQPVGVPRTSKSKVWTRKGKGSETGMDVEEPTGDVDAREVEENDGDDSEALLRFCSFDLKRSWRRGAIGEEVTKWSQDKGWLFTDVVVSQLGGDPNQLLAEIQLSFLLFSLLHNFASLEAYKRLISLHCRSPSIFSPTASSELPSPLPRPTILKHLTSLLRDILIPQLNFLRPEFFSEDMPGLDIFLIGELSALRLNLQVGLRGAGKRTEDEGWEDVLGAWSLLRNLADTKFGWELERVDQVSAVHEDDLGLELEEGEDAPVVVEL